MARREYRRMLSVAYSDVTQANYYNGLQGNSGSTGLPEKARTGPMTLPAMSTGTATPAIKFIAFQGHTAFNKFTERERLGVNASFQAEITDNVASPRMRSSRTRRNSIAPRVSQPKTSGSVGNGSRRWRARPPAR